MSILLYKRRALGDITELTIPTTTPEYKLGEIIPLINNENLNPEVISEFMYIKHTSTIDIQRPIVIGYTTDIDAEVIAIDPANQSAPIEIVAIPQITIPNGSYGFTQIKGNALCAVIATGGDINIGDTLHLEAGSEQLSPFGLPKDTVALALAFLASGQNVIDFPVLMLGNKVAITP